MRKEKINVRVGAKWWVMSAADKNKLVLYGEVVKVTNSTFHILKTNGEREIASRYLKED